MALEISGNSKTMNLPQTHLHPIQVSQYFKGLFKLKTYHEVIDEIYYQVDHLEPWVPFSKEPSPAFCLMYKLFTLKMTKKQMKGLVTHKDSPFIRAIGFLYLRFSYPLEKILDWYSDYLDDKEEFQPFSSSSKMIYYLKGNILIYFYPEFLNQNYENINKKLKEMKKINLKN
eukprot:Anaeramoba_ignava/c18934_g1_i2.p1 GENE.c18934_g1_i2~~c18934_g1_i2.p1  ORF type:complete len:172 (+),score=51.24 c18934_g1_i2:122-637(+)